jgi:antitoxin (DNA-binding transcriptional repressor) of toxin-antitoxin stability system
MKKVNITALRKNLNAHLRLVRLGEEIIVVSRSVPIARISPFRPARISEEERELVASGQLKLPEEEAMDWDEFWTTPSANLSEKEAMRAVLEEREESR